MRVQFFLALFRVVHHRERPTPKFDIRQIYSPGSLPYESLPYGNSLGLTAFRRLYGNSHKADEL